MSVETVVSRGTSRTGTGRTSTARTGTGRTSTPANPALKVVGRTATKTSAKPATTAGVAPHRISTARFALVVFGVVVLGLATSLVLNVALGSGAFELQTLTQRHADLMDAQQQAAQRLAALETTQSLAAKAKALGMVAPTGPAFITAKTGGLRGAGISPKFAAGTIADTRPIVNSHKILRPSAPTTSLLPAAALNTISTLPVAVPAAAAGGLIAAASGR